MNIPKWTVVPVALAVFFGILVNASAPRPTTPEATPAEMKRDAESTAMARSLGISRAEFDRIGRAADKHVAICREMPTLESCKTKRR